MKMLRLSNGFRSLSSTTRAGVPGIANKNVTPVKLQRYVNVADDSVLRRALEVERKKRTELGTEDVFQKKIESWLALWTVSEKGVTAGAKSGAETSKDYVRQVDSNGESSGRGRRKAAVAHVWLSEGDGLQSVIKREGETEFRLMTEYFDRFQLNEAVQPLRLLNLLGKFNMRVTVAGGGLMGQAGAVSLGLARALQNFDPNVREQLKHAGLLTRDSRVVERKKPGQKKARKKFQWVKR